MSVADADEEYYKVTTYISHKISEVRNRQKKTEETASTVRKSSKSEFKQDKIIVQLQVIYYNYR